MTGILTARILGPEGRGEFAAIQLYGTLAGAICMSGLPASIVYFGTPAKQKIPELITSAVVAGTLMALIAIPVTWIVIGTALAEKTLDVRSTAAIYLAYVPLATCSALYLASLQAESRIALWNKTRTVVSGLWLVPLGLIFFFGNTSASELAIIYLVFLATYVGAFICICIRKYGRALVFRFSRAREVLRYAIPTTSAFALNQSNLRLDLIALSIVATSSALGLYVIALAYASLLSGSLAAVLQLALPKISGVISEEERIGISARLLRISIGTSFLVMIPLLALSGVLVPVLFGEAYRGATLVAAILVVAACVSFANALLSECLKGFGFPTKVLISEAVSLATMALLLVPAFRLYDLPGVAASAVICSLAGFVCLTRYVKRALNVSLIQLLCPVRSDVAFIIDSLGNSRR